MSRTAAETSTTASPLSTPSLKSSKYINFMSVSSIDRNKDGMAHLVGDGLGLVTLAGDVLDQDDLAGADHAALAVAGGDLHTGIQVDDVLAPRRRVEIEVVVRARLAKDDAGRGQALRQLGAAPLLDPFDLDVPKMRLALGVDVEVVDPHERLPGPCASWLAPMARA